jgi:thiosulfate/3-mercaptopyruvate sulfurtransferase
MRLSALTMILCAPALATSARALAAQQTNATPLVVTTQWLAEHLDDPNVVVIHAGGRRFDSTTFRIPGTRYIAYNAFNQTVDGIGNELPTPDSLRSLFAAAGVSDDSHVVLTGQNLSVTRAFFTLDYMGHPRVSVLDGGVTKWRAEGRPVETTARSFTAGRLTLRPPRAEVVASTDWVVSHLTKPGVAFFDTRTEDEYVGAEGANGHIEGARFIDWRQFFKNSPDLELVDRATLEKLFANRAKAGDTVVAYCAVGYRASGTYFISRLLGVPVKLYDGSYDAWRMRNLPVTTAATALLDGTLMKTTGGELPVVSPDGKQIAFVAVRDGRQSDTYVIGADGKNERRLTRTPEWDERPSWVGGSVFASVRAGDSVQTQLVQAGSARATPGATLAGREAQPSPDGSQLLSLSGNPFPLMLRVQPRGGSAQAEKILHDGKTPPATNAVWSPDGTRLAYYSFDIAATRTGQIFVMNADGTNQTRKTAIPAAEGRSGRPAWSADGKRIAFQVVRDNGDPQQRVAHIYILDVESGAVTKLAPHEPGYSDEAPSWFPDGQHIAFQSDRSGTKQIWVMKADGTEPRQITRSH